jgi:hypothetical protein
LVPNWKQKIDARRQKFGAVAPPLPSKQNPDEDYAYDSIEDALGQTLAEENNAYDSTNEHGATRPPVSLLSRSADDVEYCDIDLNNGDADDKSTEDEVAVTTAVEQRRRG